MATQKQIEHLKRARAAARTKNRLGGRKRGQKNAATIEKEKVVLTREEAFKQTEEMFFGMSKKLFQAQSIVAVGTHRMVALTKDEDGKVHVETIRDERRMDNLLRDGIYGKDYLIVEGNVPDWRAADAMQNRYFGKPTENVNHSGSIDLFALHEAADELDAKEKQK
jgi:hypothetical protein